MRRGVALRGREVRAHDVREVHGRAARLRPEQPIAFFGGDAENFTYPRFDYDLAIFRVYGADGAHLVPTSYLAWSEAGPKDGDTVS